MLQIGWVVRKRKLIKSNRGIEKIVTEYERDTFGKRLKKRHRKGQI